MKIKSIGHVKIVQDSNNELTMGNNVFQLGEFVDPYRATLSNNLEEKSIFCITNNILVNVETEKLNDVLNSSRHTQVDADDDSDEINIEVAMEMRISQ